MEHQNYKNHRKFYPAHHFVFYPVLLVLIGLCVKKGMGDESSSMLWLMLAAVLLMLGWLAFMVRQHYALGNQNRIARLEVRLRYYQLTKKPFDAIEGQLSLSQILALRFAADAEFLPLLQNTLKEQTAPDNIKKSIKNWEPDLLRV